MDPHNDFDKQDVEIAPKQWSIVQDRERFFIRDADGTDRALVWRRDDAQTIIKALNVERLKALDHYWTPDPTNRFCVKCGDNPLGGVWGVHRFQIQPSDPDVPSGAVSHALRPFTSRE